MANHFVHAELSTDNIAKAKQFYKNVFDWKLNDIPKMDYTLINTGSKTSGGGIGKKQAPKAPSAWMPYVEVSDVKQSVAKAKKAGARVIVNFQAIGDMGAIGVFTDPTGATIGVWEKAKAAAKSSVKAKSSSTKRASKPPTRTAKKSSSSKRRAS